MRLAEGGDGGMGGTHIRSAAEHVGPQYTAFDVVAIHFLERGRRKGPSVDVYTRSARTEKPLLAA